MDSRDGVLTGQEQLRWYSDWTLGSRGNILTGPGQGSGDGILTGDGVLTGSSQTL